MRRVTGHLLAAALATVGACPWASSLCAEPGDAAPEAAAPPPAAPPGIVLSRPVGPPPVWMFRVPQPQRPAPNSGNAGAQPQQGGCRYVPNKLEAMV